MSETRGDINWAWLGVTTVAALLSLSVLASSVSTGFLFGSDAHAYWLVSRTPELYESGPATKDAFLYSPAFAMLVWPLTVVPWPVFLIGWTALELSALFWLLRPVAPRWRLPLVLLATPELVIGNIHLLLATSLVVALRYPAASAFGILTKITPGIGVCWFVARGEWSRVGAALLGTVSVVLCSYALAPGLWQEWVTFLLDSRAESPGGSIALLLRMGVASILVVVAARSGRPWLVPVAVTMALPVLNSPAALTVLAAIPRLLDRHFRTDRGSGDARIDSSDIVGLQQADLLGVRTHPRN